MKKVFKTFIIIVLTLFSFYYTNKVVELSKRNDPIMQKVIKVSSSEYIAPVNGIITSDTMIVGLNGKKVDINASYERMKKLNTYNSSFLEYTAIKPSITKSRNYDKLLIGSSVRDNKIAIIFKTNDMSLIKQIVYILNSNKTKATFYVDGKLIEKERSFFSRNVVLGIYGYNDIYDIVSIKHMKRVLNTLSYSNYCLYKNSSFLSSCKYFRINTIKPVLINDDLYDYLKNNKKSGSIYEIACNSNNIKELNSTIIYLKQKGYKIVSLDELLSE